MYECRIVIFEIEDVVAKYQGKWEWLGLLAC